MLVRCRWGSTKDRSPGTAVVSVGMVVDFGQARHVGAAALEQVAQALHHDAARR